MEFKLKKVVVVSLATAVALVSACSSDNPDVGSNVSSSPISGAAIDGYLAGATVYLDVNEDGQRNAGEPSANTDKDGFFSTSKDGITDYCASTATSAQKMHCLSAVETGAEVVLRSYGGFDVFTGEPFDGSLSARVSVAADGTIANQMISPLTSLLTDASTMERPQILAAYGLSEDDLDRDFLTLASFDANTTNAAIVFHKVVTVFAKVLDDQYEAFGQESGFPDSINGLIYKALAAEIAKGSKLDNTSLTAAYNAIQLSIQNLYTSTGIGYPGPISGSAAITNAVKIANLVDNALPAASLVFNEVKSRVIGIEMVVNKMVDNDADVDAAITDAEDPNSPLYTTLDAATNIDFSALTRIDYNNQAHTFGGVAVSGAAPLTALANKQLYVAYDENENLSDNKSGSAQFFFNSNESGTSGTLNLCLSYDDGLSAIDVQETSGTLINGTWFAIDDNRLVLTLEGSFDISLISKGTKGSQTKFSLSYGGETVSWLSNQGLIDSLTDINAATQPTTNTECKVLLDAKKLAI